MKNTLSDYINILFALIFVILAVYNVSKNIDLAILYLMLFAVSLQNIKDDITKLRFKILNEKLDKIQQQIECKNDN